MRMEKISDTADQSMTFSPNPEGVVKPPRKWPALLSGIVIILYSLLGLFMTLFYMGDALSVGIALGIVMHVSILLSGIALLVCRAPNCRTFPSCHLYPGAAFRFCFSVYCLATGTFSFVDCLRILRPASSGCSIWSDYVSDWTGTSHLRDLDAAGRKKPQIVRF